MTSPPPTSIVEVLPAEILFMVEEYLDLYDRLQFSRTCHHKKKLFNINQKKELDALPCKEMLKYLHQASLHLADYWVCVPCVRLHRVNKLDLPFGEYSQHWPKCQRFQRRFMGPISLFYAPREMHIQLAHKYSMSRFKGVHQDYLRELMRPRRVIMQGPRLWQYEQEHKIVEGSFLVLATTFMSFQGSMSEYMLLHGTALCTHVRVELVDWIDEPLDDTLTQLSVKLGPTNAGLSAPGKRDSGQMYWCYYCMSDFCIRLENGYLTIRYWQDFGEQEVPPSQEWQDHLMTYLPEAEEEEMSPWLYEESSDVMER